MKELIMEKKKGWIIADVTTILWAVLVVVLCVSASVRAETHFDVGPYTVNCQIIGEVYVYPGVIVTLEGNAHIADDPDPTGEKGNMYLAGIVDFHAGVVDGFIDVMDATITVYGTGFEDSSGPISATEWTPAGGSDTLTGTYENDTPISLLFNSDTAITLVDTGGGGPIEVTIDIKPGSDPNPINQGSNGLVPVAILTTDDFDASTVDPGTVALAGAEVAVRGKSEKLMARLEDVDGDGDYDLMLQVDTESMADLGDGGEVILTGYTYEEFGGEEIQGTDSVIIVPPE
jgi:hypothetical protein